MKKKIAIAFLAIFTVCCSYTRIVKSWKDPNSTDNPDKWEKVLVAVQSTSAVKRRVAEDKLASISDKVYASYKLFPDKSVLENENEMKKTISDGEFDAIMTLRLTDKNKETSYIPSSYQSGYWGYHRAYWTGYYDPGYYYTEDTYYPIETQVFFFSRKQTCLVRNHISVNPSKIDKTIVEIAKMTYKQMQKDGFIHPEKYIGKAIVETDKTI